MTTALASERVDRIGALVRASSPRDRAHTDRGRVIEVVTVAPVALVRWHCGCVSYVPLRRLVIDLGAPLPACEARGCTNPRWDGPYCPSHRDTGATPARPASGPAQHDGEPIEPSVSVDIADSRAPADGAHAIDGVRTPARAETGTPARADGRGPLPPPVQTAARGGTAPSAPRATSSPPAVREGAGPGTAPAPTRRTVEAGGRFTWSRDAILRSLRAWAESHDGTAPRSTDWQRSCPRRTHPSFSTVVYVFGTWRAGIEAAGLSVPSRQHRWPADRVIAVLQAWAREHGRSPSSEDWSTGASAARPSSKTVEKRFGSWSAGLEAAGLPPNPPGSSGARLRVAIEALQAIAAGVDHPEELARTALAIVSPSR